MWTESEKAFAEVLMRAFHKKVNVFLKVRVLDVTGVAVDGSGDPTLLLALTPGDAERAIFFAKFESMWAALVPAQAKPSSTSGVSYANDLR